MVRREGFEPPAFWSVGCLKAKSELFRLRFVLFTTVRSADFPLFPSSPACFFRILGQNWVRSCCEEGRTAKHEMKKCQKMKKDLPVRGRTVYNSIIQKMAENASEMLSGAAPITFQVKKVRFMQTAPQIAENMLH